MRENTDHKNYEYGHFLCSGWYYLKTFQCLSTIMEYYYYHYYYFYYDDDDDANTQ